jgi:hypothetical protein
MRILILVAALVSFSAFAQTRVKENIKQQSVSSSEEPSAPREVKKPVKASGKSSK